MTDPMRISSQTPMAPAKITEDIVLDELQTPLAKGEDRFERMKEIFQNLNPDDAKALLDRLQSNNQNDPLTAQFNAAFSGQKAEDLKAVLRAKFQGGPADSAPANQPAQPSTFRPTQARESLPPANTTAMPDFGRQRVRTNELVEMPSVTEHTTKLLDNE